LGDIFCEFEEEFMGYDGLLADTEGQEGENCRYAP
jgi:hypothetical protein